MNLKSGNALSSEIEQIVDSTIIEEVDLANIEQNAQQQILKLDDIIKNQEEGIKERPFTTMMTDQRQQLMSTMLNSKTQESNQNDTKSFILSPPDIITSTFQIAQSRNSADTQLEEQNTGNSQDRSNNSSQLQKAPHRQLSNLFNQTSVLGYIEKGMGKAFQNNINQVFKHQSNNNLDSIKMVPIEKCSLNQHFDIEKILSNNCYLGVCYKMRDKRFLLKKLHKKVSLEQLKPWLDLPPQQPYQNFVNCYGIIDVDGEIYQLTDIVEEDVQLASQKNEFEFVKRMSHQEVNRSSQQSSIEAQDTMKTTSLNNSPIRIENDKFNNFSLAISQQVTVEDEFKIETQKVKTVDNSPLKKALQGKEQQTYFGYRRPVSQLHIAKNMYQMIDWMNLGNLSGLPKIPEFYMRCLLGFIIQVSRAFSHCHKHNVVHGNFNLSKILVQKTQFDLQKYDQIMLKKSKKGLRSRQSLILDQKFDSYNFHITNFEPFKVNMMLERYNKKEQGKYEEMNQVGQMRLNEEDLLKILKVQDLQSFANSIVEIMVGKTEEKSKIEKTENNKSPERDHRTNAIGGISLDLIPLIWIKMPETQDIFKILGKCYSPIKDQLQAKTHEIFDEIHQIASQAYKQSFGWEDGLNGNYTFKMNRQNLEYQNRLQSVVYNNQAVSLYLNITDATCTDTKNKTVSQIRSLLNKALQYSPQNQVAMLNKTLLDWGQGKIRDGHVLEFAQKELFKYDKHLAILFFVLFKQNVYGGRITNNEIDELNHFSDKCDLFLSNLARTMLSHPDLIKYRKLKDKHKIQSEHQKFVENNLRENVQVASNHRFDMNIQFETQSVSFSNNEKYGCILGIKQGIIVDCKTGAQLFKFMIPQYKPRSEFEKFNDAKQAKSTWLNVAYKGSMLFDAQEDEEKQVHSSLQETDEEVTFKQTEMSDSKNQDILISESSRAQSPLQEQIPHSMLGEVKVYLEEQLLYQKFKSKWEANIGNQGRILAMFDRSQQERNKHCKYEQNKKEKMLIYTIVFSKLQNNDPAQNVLDMRQLLNDQEVLSFGINDHGASGNFSQICIQAKDLYLYFIDFSTHVLIRKVDSQRSNPLMKSIFYDHTNQENEQYYQSFHEFVQDQESKGNQVRIPKLDDEIIAIKQGDSNLVRIYDIKKHQYVRQLLLESEDIAFGQDVHEEKEIMTSSDEESSNSDSSDQSDDLGKAIDEDNRKKALTLAKKALSRERKRLRQSLITDLNKVTYFDISPKASIIVAVFSTEIVFRQLNQAERKQSQNTVQYHKSLAFLPLYLDEDFNYFMNKKKLFDLKKQDFTIEDNFDKNIDCEVISVRDIDRSIYIYNILRKKNANVLLYVKNEMIVELGKYVRKFIDNLKSLFYIKVNQLTKPKKIQTVLEIIKNYYSLDPIGIKTQGLQELRPLCILQQIQFERSFEYIKDFICSSNTSQMYSYVILNRSLHCYNIVDKRLMFKMNLPTAQLINGQKRMIITESDKLIIIKTGDVSLQIINVPIMIDIASRNQDYQKSDQADLKVAGHLTPDTVIKMDFGKEQYQENNDQTQALIGKDDEESEDDDEDISGFSFYEMDEEIKGIYTSRNYTDFSFLGILYEHKFTVYYIYEDETKGSEIDKCMEIDYRHNKEFSKYGKTVCLDFDDNGTNLITATNQGWILIWEIQNEEIIKQIQLFDQDSTQPFKISMIREIIEEKTILVYSQKSHTLAIVEVPIQIQAATENERTKTEEYSFEDGQSTILTPSTKKDTLPLMRDTIYLKFDSGIKKLTVEQTFKYFLTTLENGKIQVYDIMTGQLKNELPSQSDGDTQVVFIDDYCTYITYLRSERDNKLYFEFIDWGFTCKKLKRPQVKPELIIIQDPSAVENKQEEPSPLLPQKEDKKTTCEIF